ncbi:MAG: pilus assembly protein PilM [Rhodospirillales bacterium]|nr:MAG: pilus assembly protein PilM [Rhodospirillales bacterium]
MRSGLAVAADTFAAFFRWWLGELSGLVPGSLRAAFSGEPALISVTIGADAATVARLLRGSRQELGSIDLSLGDAEQRVAMGRLIRGRMRGAVVVLALSAERVLRKTLNLPSAAEAELADLLHFELDRQTPFSPEQACYDYRVVDRDKTAGRMRVEIAVAPRDEVERAQALAAGWGLTPVLVTAGGDEESDRPFDLSGRTESSGLGGRAILMAVLAVIAAALLVVAVALPLRWQATAAAEADRTLAAARTAAREATDLREALRQRRQDARFLIDRKLNMPLSVSVLADLTRLLPDDTYLFELRFQDGRVRVRGYAPAASPLLELFETHPRFAGARFESPVTRVPNIDKERFDLSVALAAEGST